MSGSQKAHGHKSLEPTAPTTAVPNCKSVSCILRALISNMHSTLCTTVFAGQWVICRKGPGVNFLNCISWDFWCHFPYWPSPLSSRYAQEQKVNITCAWCLCTCADAARNLQMISWNSCTQAGMKRIPPCLRMQSNTGLFKLIYIHINCLKDSLLETGSTSSSWQPEMVPIMDHRVSQQLPKDTSDLFLTSMNTVKLPISFTTCQSLRLQPDKGEAGRVALNHVGTRVMMSPFCGLSNGWWTW